MNVGKLQENAGAAFELLYEGEESAYTALRGAMRKLEDPSLNEVRLTLEPAVIAIQEASHALRDYLGKLEANPGRLEEVENRLAVLGKLKRKVRRHPGSGARFPGRCARAHFRRRECRRTDGKTAQAARSAGRGV